MEQRRLGRTGHLSSVAVLGAAAFWDGTEERTAEAFHAALEAGVNHLDIAPQYGRAQELVGPLIPAVRDRLFIGCKSLRHSADGVQAQLEESLQLLGCDSFDLYQLHAVTDLDELERRGGAVDALTRARDEGLCQSIGITGHGLGAPAAHLEAVRRYDLDTVMFPVNPRLWADPAYRHDAEALLDEAGRRDLGVMAIKCAAARPWDDRPHTAGTWYEPYATPAEVDRGVRFALSVPGVHAVCTPGDLDILALALRSAAAVTPMGTDEREEATLAVADEALIFSMPTTP